MLWQETLARVGPGVGLGEVPPGELGGHPLRQSLENSRGLAALSEAVFGEFLNRWTNDRFIASPHRVVPPERDRYSMATFFNPAPDTVAEPLDTCCGPDNPPKYPPISYAESQGVVQGE